jgi:ATP-dependent Clp protease ATP-binding subunit ClpA
VHNALTATFRQTLDQAHREARQLNQDFIGTEHVVLAFLAVPASEAGKALNAAIVADELCRWLINKMPKVRKPPVVVGRLPASPKLTALINTAIVKAQAAGQTGVSTRFLLLAILEDDGGVIRQALSACGGDWDDLVRTLEQWSEPAEK